MMKLIPWCNGNTTDFISVDQGSSLRGITKCLYKQINSKK